MKKNSHLSIGAKLGLFWMLVAGGLAGANEWTGSVGVGFLSDPTIPAVFPQIDFYQTPQWSVGPAAQLAVGTNASLVGLGLNSRMNLTGHPRIVPNLEGTISLARYVNNSINSVGLMLSGGVGFDFVVRRDLSLGVQVKANAYLPASVSFVSFQLLVIRMPI